MSGGMISVKLVALIGAALFLGCALALWIWREPVQRAVAAFPRHRWAGIVLSAVALFWATAIVHQARLGRFELVKPWLWPFWPVAVGAVALFMDELLAVRALGGLLLLAMNPVLRSVRLHPSPWTAVIAVLAYVVIVVAMAWVLGPYRFRRWIGWGVAPGRAAVFAAALGGIGVLLALLGTLAL